jgi:glycosidase
MLHFLENHDEQRIPSADFASSPEAALPAMVVSATLSRSPTLVYFGQDVGEAATQAAGIGAATRTSIFDYIGVPAHQRWMNGGRFDGGKSSNSEKQLRAYYQRLLNLSRTVPALKGDYMALETSDDKVFSFSRYSKEQQLIIISNFDAKQARSLSLALDKSLIKAWGKESDYLSASMNSACTLTFTDLLNPNKKQYPQRLISDDKAAAKLQLTLAPLESLVLAISASACMITSH